MQASATYGPRAEDPRRHFARPAASFWSRSMVSKVPRNLFILGVWFRKSSPRGRGTPLSYPPRRIFSVFVNSLSVRVEPPLAASSLARPAKQIYFTNLALRSKRLPAPVLDIEDLSWFCLYGMQGTTSCRKRLIWRALASQARLFLQRVVPCIPYKQNHNRSYFSHIKLPNNQWNILNNCKALEIKPMKRSVCKWRRLIRPR